MIASSMVVKFFLAARLFAMIFFVVSLVPLAPAEIAAFLRLIGSC